VPDVPERNKVTSSEACSDIREKITERSEPSKTPASKHFLTELEAGSNGVT